MRFSEHALKSGEIRFFHSSVPKGRREYREHHHTMCELSLSLSGNGLYSVRGESIPFSPGDLFLFGADEVHCITEVYDEPFELLNIHFESKLLWAGGDVAYLPLLKLFNARSDTFKNKIPGSAKRTAEIRHFIKEAENEFINEETGYEIRIRLLLYSVLLHLYRYYSLVREDDNTVHSAELLALLASSVEYIDSHFTEDISLSDIANEAHLSRAYFSTVFKKYNGLTPFEYITIKRVEKAIEYLKTTELSKLEIASLCGFNSSANFYKAFSKITGKKPGDYIF